MNISTDPWILVGEANSHERYYISLLLRAAGFSIYSEDTHGKWIIGTYKHNSVGHYCDRGDDGMPRQTVYTVTKPIDYKERYGNVTYLEYEELVKLLKEKIIEDGHNE